MTNISLYMVPCMDSSPFSVDNNITCGSPDSQIDRIVTRLDTSGIMFVKYPKKTWAPTALPTFQSATPKPTGK